jgi:hypothetical protein
MRLRLFEHVRRLAHPHAGRFWRRRDIHPPGRPGDSRGQVTTAGPEAAGRHRRGAAEDYPPPRPPWEEPAAPPWDQQQAPPPWSGPPSGPHRPVPPPGGPPPPRQPSTGPFPSGGPGARPPTGPAARPPAGPLTGPQARPPAGPQARPPAGGRGDPPAVPVGGARARVRPDLNPYGTAPVAPPAEAAPGAVRDSRRSRARPATDRRWLEADRGYLGAQRPPGAARPRLPFAHARAPSQANQADLRDGRRNCGTLETVLWRQWDAAMYVPDEAVQAIDRLAELPQKIKDKLVAGLDGIFVGPGGVPQLDDMTALSGVPLPSGRATWDACAGAYGERKIVVGTRPSPTPDVMCHEVGHALDDIDAPAGQWQSDSAEFRMLYDQCLAHLASDFHKQPGGLGRKEFFADAFAAIASRQRPALVDMLGGDTRGALNVMLYFNRRYGI